MSILDTINANTEQVRNGKNNVASAIASKGGSVISSGTVPTFNELVAGVNSIDTSGGSSGGGTVVETVVSAGNGAITIMAQATENISAHDTVAATMQNDILPIYAPAYYIPKEVKIGSATETPTIQSHSIAIPSFNSNAQTVLLSDDLMVVRYTTGKLLIFQKQGEEFVQLKIGDEYQYLTGTNLFVDYDEDTKMIYVLDYNNTNISFDLYAYSIGTTAIYLEHRDTLSLGLSSAPAVSNMAMFVSKSHVFIVISNVGVFIFKDTGGAFEQLTTYSNTGVIRLQDYVQKSGTELYISLGVKGLILKYELVDGSYTLSSKSAGNLSMNIDTATLNRDVTAVILGNGTTRNYYQITESGSTITLTKGTMPTNLTGQTFSFMKDSNEILRFGSSSFSGANALYRIVDGAAVLVTTPSVDFVPTVTGNTYGAYIFGRPAKSKSSAIVCLSTVGQLVIFEPNYAESLYIVKKANNRISTEAGIYGYGIAAESINAGSEGVVSLGFLT